MVVGDFDLPAYLAWTQGRPVRGSAVLANFLHEWTHRWCFHSPAGSALALLRMRAACRAYRGRSAIDDYVRCMTASTILEPFAEGLALFAEFDAYPGESRWMSQALVASTIFFAPPLESGKPLLGMKGLLQTLRREPMLLERKAGIYAAPANEFDPYLIGYLSVRSLWCQMAAACSELHDKDLFLSYLRSYIYDDPGMVLCILAPYPSELHAANGIVNHLLARVHALVSFDGLSDRVERWIQSAEDGQMDVASICARPTDKQRALSMLEDALVEGVEDDADQTLATWMLMTLEERQICAIASAQVRLETQPGTNLVSIIAQSGDTPLFTIANGTIGGAKEGELVIVASIDGHAAGVLLRIDQDVTVVSTFGDFDASQLSLAKRHVANGPTVASLQEKFRANLEHSPDVKTAWDLVAQRVSPAMRDLYGPLATLNADESKWAAAFSALQSQGLFGVLGRDGELTRAVAAIGLVNTYSNQVSAVRMIGKVLGVDEQALEVALGLSTCEGLPIVIRKGESVVALV